MNKNSLLSWLASAQPVDDDRPKLLKFYREYGLDYVTDGFAMHVTAEPEPLVGTKGMDLGTSLITSTMNREVIATAILHPPDLQLALKAACVTAAYSPSGYYRRSKSIRLSIGYLMFPNEHKLHISLDLLARAIPPKCTTVTIRSYGASNPVAILTNNTCALVMPAMPPSYTEHIEFPANSQALVIGTRTSIHCVPVLTGNDYDTFDPLAIIASKQQKPEETSGAEDQH
jgi:hypothetical protein